VYKRLLTNIFFVLLSHGLYSGTGFAQELPDPTRPPGAQDSSAKDSPRLQKWILSSTLIANGRRNAIINGQLVTIGQVVNQAKVVSIQPNEVWLLHKQKQMHIKLLARDIKDFSPTAAK